MMKRPLKTHFDFKNVCNGLQRSKGIMTILILFLAFNLSYSQSISRTECNCLNNGSTDANGQFGESITINSDPGETWLLESTDGLFQTTSPAPPGDPIPFPADYVIPEVGPGVYILEAIRLPDTEWSAMISEGGNPVAITSSHLCEAPTEVMLGDMGTCVGTIETYNLGVPNSQVELMTWTLSGGGSIVGGQGTGTVFIEWDEVVGSYDLSYEGTVFAYDGQNTGGCDVSGTSNIKVMDEEAFSMACNNQVNISLNGNCELDFVADMILEDMMFTNDSYDLEFTDIETGEPVVGPTLGMEYVGKTLQVKVVHECSGNSCWGVVLLEDKAIPPLDCGDDVTIDCDEIMAPSVTGFPVPDDVTIINLGDDKFRLIGFDLCSDVELIYEDVPVTTNLCDGPYSSIINRNWLATDGSGNTTTCTEQIFVNKATLTDITFPENWDDVLGPNPSLQACGNYPKLENGNPDPSYTGQPEGIFCLNVKVDYEDIRLAKCGTEAYKVRRRWTVQDLCNGESLPPFTQNITVMDNDAPVVSAPQDFTVGTTPLSCSSLIEVAAPTVTQECSDWEYTVSYNVVTPGGDPYFQPINTGVVPQSDGTYLISGLDDIEGNQIWILYYVTDACGNIGTDYNTVTIIDDIQPIPVCDLHTFIGLNENGIGYASIESFDDGSWDNCGEITREVRRLDNFGCGESSQWSDKVKFCCEDVGSIIMVQMRVTDQSGNSNICMVEAEVQDNHAPVITYCPADITIDCDDDTVNLDQYGTATATDNCTVTVTSTASRNINSCGTGIITRTFRAEDNYDNFVTCVQRIRVVALDPFYINPNNPNDPSDDIIWPGAHTINNGCATTGINPDDLPAGKQRPVVLDEGCSQVSFTYDDVIFQYTEEACAKVLRTWKVIDDCIYVPYGNVGVWTYTQVIKIENSIAPTFITGCSAADFTVTQQANCTARIEGSSSAVDDCTSVDDLKYSYKVDEDNNGSIDFTSSGNSINRQVSFGSHRIIWVVEDECGNIRECASIINVQDNKAPTPYCLSEIVTVLMEESGTVTIWASDFDNGSFDNCADDDELIASFSPNTSNTNMQFTCDDLDGESTTIELQVYVTDPSGNQDFCTTSIVIQDNNNNCPDNTSGGGTNEESRIALGGHIYNDENENVSGIQVSVMADLPEFPVVSMTDADGGYTFNNLLADESYNLVPSNNVDYNDGVSTLDLVLIQQHLLGINSLDNPYKVIAADINNSESITASDLLQLRKLILGIYSELPSNDSWRFVDASLVFEDANDPFPFTENVTMENVTEDYMDADFVAIKVGDVNNSASNELKGNNESSTRSSLTLTVEDQYLEVGTQAVEMNISDIADVYGLQFALDINENLVSDINMASDYLNVTEGNYVNEGNKITASIHNPASELIADQLLTLIIEVKKAGYLSEMINLTSKSFNNEIYTEVNDNVISTPINLEMLNRSSDANSFELLQNVPNPFTTTTDIGFVLPSDQKVSLRVLDVTGKVLVSKNGSFPKGYNTITLDVSDINASGVLYYQLDTERNSASKKMIIIK